MIKGILQKIFKKEKEKPISKEIMKEVKGTLGETRQEFRLQLLDRNHYKVLNDIIIPYKNKTSQIDHIVISTYGIFVIENKNFSGNIYGKEKEQTWTQYLGGKSNKFYNPVLQNYGHIKAIKNIIGENKNIISVIVFSNKAIIKKVHIENDNIKLINESDLLKIIREYDKEIITIEEVNKVWNQILESMASIKQDNKVHIENVKSIIKEKKNKCPKCSNELVIRKGQHGEFMGCASFPKCRYTERYQQ